MERLPERDLSGEPVETPRFERCWWCGREWHPGLVWSLPDPDEHMLVRRFGLCHALNIAKQLAFRGDLAGNRLETMKAWEIIAEAGRLAEDGAFVEGAPNVVERALERLKPIRAHSPLTLRAASDLARAS